MLTLLKPLYFSSPLELQWEILKKKPGEYGDLYLFSEYTVIS